MKRLARILALVLLGAFAVGAVAHAAATAGMSAQMAVAADPDTDDCDGCDGASDMAAGCDQNCVQSFAALPPSELVDVVPAEASPGRSISSDVVGRTSPPERHPPR